MSDRTKRRQLERAAEKIMEGEAISKSHMRFVDSLYWAPAERASGILSMINNMREHLRKDNIKNKRHPADGIPTDWDILCFACEYVGAKALALGDNEFLSYAVGVARWVNATHYSNPSKLYGPPDRKEAEENETVQGEGPEQEAEVRRGDQPGDHDPGTGDHEEPREAQGSSGAVGVGDHDGSSDPSGS